MSDVRTTPMTGLWRLLPRLKGAHMQGEAAADVLRVHTDTRTLQAGDLFVALQGERFDAHAFLPQAAHAGAVAAVASYGLAECGLPGVTVPNTRQALGELAQLWRQQFDLPVIAVTGSNGKTTVTQMVASVLKAAAGEAALATQGNLNNDIGVPLSVLRLREQHRLAVFELGMNHPGEIASLAAMALPTVVLVNNAQREHQEFMQTVEAVARENASAFQVLHQQGVAVFPSDDAYTPVWQELAAQQGCATLMFSDSDPQAAVHGQAQWLDGAWQMTLHTPQGQADVRLNIAGRHNVRNALAAAACAHAAGVDLAHIVQGLQQFEPVQGRSRALALDLHGQSVTLVDDTYNANPDSVRAAIDVLAELHGPRLLVLGDMGEVGEQGLAFHEEVLRHALAQGIEHIWVTGEWMRQASVQLTQETQAVRYCSTVEALLPQVTQQAFCCASIVVKGSRFMKMERVVNAIAALHTKPNGAQREGAHAA
jgi:UDP-N-acetylmuramoyl-tripeptide--D-alanyl-D-alanine ligase